MIDKVVVFNRDRKGSIQTTQRVNIYFSFIGNFVPPAEPINPEVQASMDAERARIEAIKDKRHEQYLRRKENGKQKEYEERYNARRRNLKEQKVARLPKNGIPRQEYEEYRKKTRTEFDMPEALLANM